MMPANLDGIAILNINDVDCRRIVNGISKTEATNLLENADLIAKTWDFIKHKNLLSHIKICKEIIILSDIKNEE